jgi:GH35 family endo-1,4-beta-xylanase
MSWRIYLPGLWLACLAVSASAQSFNGNTLAYRSSGASAGSDWTLSENGYVGTYINVPASPGGLTDVTIDAQASGQAGSGADPNMNIVIADTKTGFDVTPGSFNTYSHTFSLPAGTYFVRTEFNNQDAAADRKLTVRSLAFSGATVENLAINGNLTNQQTNDGYALAAGDTYINTFRKGSAQVTLSGVRPGSPVRAQLTQHAFNFGTEVGGTFVGNGSQGQYDVNTYLNNANYTNFLTKYFNTVTQGNAGKWDSDEATRNTVTMQASDRIDQFAVDHGMRVRQHNLIWGNQQPAWVNTMLNNPTGTDALLATTNKNALRTEVSQRIGYYLGNNNSGTAGNPAAKYYNMVEMDLLNEEVHQNKYWSIYGASGIADIFNEAANTISSAGANTRLALNEYNVLQFGTDAYGNWFRHDTESIKNNGGAVSAIGVQYYPTHATGTNDHSPARITQTFENLAVSGLPISLTEFGVQNSQSGAGATTPALAAQYLTDTMRLTFGNPDVSTFDMWGFWANDMWSQAANAPLLDANFNLTVPGQNFVNLMNQWSTDTTVPVGADGTVNFNGFYGKYQLSVGVYKATMSLDKGTGQYALSFNIGAGDFNFDGVVDAADYTVWRDTMGSTTDLRADADNNGIVDDGDYGAWVSNFGTVYVAGGAGASASAAVPEPTSAILLAIGAAGMAVCGWRRIRPSITIEPV